MKRLIEGSIRFRGLIIAAAAGLVVFGFTQLPNAPVDSLPEFKPTVVEVQTEALGLSAEEVEQFITVPLEQDLLNGVAFLEDIESASLPGLSSVVMTFEPGTDLLDARQVVAERLTQAVAVAGLPAVADTPQMLQPLSSTNRAAIVRLSAESLSPIDVSVLARWVIGPRLLGVEGVANVSTWGLRDRQLQVQVDPDELRDAGVSLNSVIRSTGNALEVSPLTYLEASKPGTGGFIDTANQRLQVFHEQTIKTPDELAQVPLEDQDGDAVIVNGEALTIGDVAAVSVDHQPLIGDAVCSDGECQLLVIEKFPGANTVAVAQGIEDALDALRPGMAGMDMDTSIYRPADYVQTSFSNMRAAMAIGAVLLVLTLAIFLFNWRLVLAAVAVIGVSLAAAVTILLVRGETLNLMVLAGLVLATLVLIDDAVVDTDQLAGRVRAKDHAGDAPIERRVTSSLLATRPLMLYSALIIIVAAVPVYFMQGLGGAFLPPVLSTYLLAIVASLLVTLTLTPALGAALLDGDRTSPVARSLQRAFDKYGARFAVHPATAIVAVVVVVLGVASLAFLRPSLDPGLRERDILVQLEAAPGTSLTRMNEMTADFVDQVAELQGVRSVGANVGRAVMSDQVSNVNEAEVWINLDANAAYDATVRAIGNTAESNPEVVSAVLTHSQARVDELLRRTEHDIVVRVYGENPAVVDDLAIQIEQRLDRIDGMTDLRIDRQPEERTLQVTTDLQAAQAVGLKPGDIRRTAAILLNGITVGNLFEDQKVFDVVVWGTPEVRESIENLQDLQIETDNFGPVRLGTVADIEVVNAPAVIRHESVRTYLDLTANVTDRSVNAVAADVAAAVDQVAFPLEHHAELLGSFDARQSQLWLMVALWAGIAAFIFLLLQAAVNSWRLGLFALLELSVPVAGGLIAIWLTGGSVALGSAVGLFVVFGFGARQAILLINRYQMLQREGIPLGPDLVIRGTRDRIPPLLTTAVAATVFLLPFLFRGRTIGFEILQPMAVVVVGGVFATLLLIVLVMPAVYLRLGEVEQRSIWDDELYDMTGNELAAAVGAEADE